MTTTTMYSLSTVSILFPAWEVLVVVSPENFHSLSLYSHAHTDRYLCLYPNNDTSRAKPSGTIHSPDRQYFLCDLPIRTRRRLPFPQPVLVKSTAHPSPSPNPKPLLRWNFIVYDTLTTENDVVLFVKGVNKRPGFNREPTEFMCLFGNSVRTAVTSSSQEVFRCQKPKLTAVSHSGLIKASLEFVTDTTVVPSLSHYAPSRTVQKQNRKLLLCACTMVYNVAKFLREWVMYHSRIGIERFILYDNDSNDELQKIVADLINEGYDIETLFWLWPKTQEAGFSHCAIYANNSCTWMMYTDVDEFIYSPAWSNYSHPSKSLLKSLLFEALTDNRDFSNDLPNSLNPIGQIMIGCNEFGPSNRRSHPVEGVMQGYNCRKLNENRHKSIVLLDAVDYSLSNVIHHFELKSGYRVKRLNIEEAVVNHYKFQVWSEFKAKFRRRVSAYVVDWMQNVNPKSNDRTPGLGFTPVEPEGWPEKFCEVYDDRLKELTRKWFSVDAKSGY